MACFAAGAAIGGAVGGAMSAGSASNAAGASLEAVELTTAVSRSLHEHWKSYYAQCDAAAISEVCAEPIYVAPSATIAGRTRLEVVKTLGRKRQQLYRGQNVYHVGKMAQDCNLLAALEGTAALDASEWGYRRGQNLEIQRNQKRLENIYAYLGLGRNLLSNALSASAIAGAIANQLGAEQGKALAGWSQFAGFLGTKEGQRFAKDVFGGIERIQVEAAAAQGYESDSEAIARMEQGAAAPATVPADQTLGGTEQAPTETTPDAAPPSGNEPLGGNDTFGGEYGAGVTPT